MFSIFRIEGKEDLTSSLLKRLKLISSVVSVLLAGSGERFGKEIGEFFQKSCTLFSQLTGQLILNLENTEFMKLLNVIIRGLVMCVS